VCVLAVRGCWEGEEVERALQPWGWREREKAEPSGDGQGAAVLVAVPAAAALPASAAAHTAGERILADTQ
jgi:hypothetical protein